MSNDIRSAAVQALSALESIVDLDGMTEGGPQAVAALRRALAAAPAPMPIPPDCRPDEWRRAVIAVYVAARGDSSCGFVPSNVLDAMKAILLYAASPSPQQEGADVWKDAVLDHLAICCMDAPQDEPPYKIVGRIIDWHVAVATDPLVVCGHMCAALQAGQQEGKE